MARQEMLYIELKTNQSDRGSAWICLATISSSNRTIYFNDKALKRTSGGGISGNHSDIETGEEYWVSGVKKDGSDRHWAGGGVVMIDSRVLDDYLALRGLNEIDPRYYKVVTVEKTDITRFHEIENEALSQDGCT